MATKTTKKPSDSGVVRKKTVKTKTPKVTTNIAFILDESGSMLTRINDTISGFNEYVNSLKQQEGTFKLTLTKFGGPVTGVVYSDTPITKVPELTTETYTPSNLTPLYDAIGKTIADMTDAVKRKKNKDVLIVILTDGQENNSKEYDRTKIFDLISEKQKEGWTFVFLGADQDAYEAAGGIGISKGNTLSYSSANTVQTYTTLAAQTTMHSYELKTGKRSVGGASADFFGV